MVEWGDNEEEDDKCSDKWWDAPKSNIHKDGWILEVLDEDKPQWDMEVNITVGLAAMNCLNCSTIWGTNVDGGVKYVSFSIEGAAAAYCGGLKCGNERHNWDCLEDMFCYEGWDYACNLVCCYYWFLLLNNKGQFAFQWFFFFLQIAHSSNGTLGWLWFKYWGRCRTTKTAHVAVLVPLSTWDLMLVSLAIYSCTTESIMGRRVWCEIDP